MTSWPTDADNAWVICKIGRYSLHYARARRLNATDRSSSPAIAVVSQPDAQGMGMKPLDGIRVLDIATILAGPFAATSLAEFGAEVIKIEKPGEGCALRRLGTRSPTGGTYWWLSDARNKKSIELDLRTETDAETFRQLAETADIVVENFRPGTLEKWGLGFESLRQTNPGLIMLSISGFGQDGPKAHMTSVARIAEGFAGLTYLTGDPKGLPSITGASGLGDYVSGTFGALGILLALRARDQSGRGQRIDLALYEGVLRYLDELAAVYSHTGHIRERLGSETHRSVPHATYRCSDDRFVGIACTIDSLFARLAEVMGRLDMLEDERYATNAARIERRGEVNGIVSDWVGRHTREEIIELCAKVALPCGPVYDISETIADPQIRHRKSILEVEHPELGPISIPGVIPHLTETPGEVRHLGPKLGADNHLLDDLLAAPKRQSFIQGGHDDA